jgi:hypothetical protein
MKIIFFVIFILSYVASLFLGNWLQSKTRGYSGTYALLTNITAILLFFFYLWLLSGYWSLYLVLAFVGLISTGAVLSKTLWAIMGPEESEEYYDQIMFFSADVGMRGPYWVILLSLGLLAYMALFPGLIGYVYFAGDVPQEALMQSIIKYAATLNVIVGIFTFSYPGFNLLSSKNISEDVRSGYVILNISSLFTITMWIALALWSFQAGSDSGYSIPTGSAIDFKISPLFLFIVFAVLGFLLFLPYLMGSQSGKKWRTRLLQSRKKLIVELIGILNDPELDIAELQKLETKIGAEEEKLKKKDPTIANWARYDGMKPEQVEDPNEAQMLAFYNKCRDVDIRFKQLDFLAKLRRDIQKMIPVFEGQKPPVTDKYVKNYEYDEKQLTEQVKEQESYSPQIYATIFFLVSAVLTQLFSTFGQWAWALFTKPTG